MRKEQNNFPLVYTNIAPYINVTKKYKNSIVWVYKGPNRCYSYIENAFSIAKLIFYDENIR